MTHQVKSGPQGLVERIEALLPKQHGSARQYFIAGDPDPKPIFVLLDRYAYDAAELIDKYEDLLRDCKAALSAPMAQAQGDEARDAFEAWYSDGDPTYRAIERSGAGYVLASADAAWSAWQSAWTAALASRPSAPVAQEPVAPFEAACSGLRYYKPESCGEIAAIWLDGRRYPLAPQAGQKPLCEECGGIGERLILDESYSCPGCGGTGYARQARMGAGEVEAWLSGKIHSIEWGHKTFFKMVLLDDVRALASQLSEAQVPRVCDGKEQEAFEAWAKERRYDMTCHPLHWLFLDAKTDAARQGWKAALEYVAAALPAQPQERGAESDAVCPSCQSATCRCDDLIRHLTSPADQSAPAAGESEGCPACKGSGKLVLHGARGSVAHEYPCSMCALREIAGCENRTATPQQFADHLQREARQALEQRPARAGEEESDG